MTGPTYSNDPSTADDSVFAPTVVDVDDNDDDDDDDDFARQMRERTKQRREREDAALAHLRVQVRHLEAALTAETKRRVAAVAAASEAAAEAVQQVAEEWQKTVVSEQNETGRRLQLLEERVEKLEHVWQRDVRQLHGKIENKRRVL